MSFMSVVITGRVEFSGLSAPLASKAKVGDPVKMSFLTLPDRIDRFAEGFHVHDGNAPYPMCNETFALSIGDMKMSMGPALPKLAVPPPSTLAWDGTAFLNIVKSHPVNDGLFVSLSTQSADLVPLKLANWVSKTTFQGKFNIG